MSRKKISTTIYVTPEQSEQLKVLHERTKVPTSVYIREGIDLVLRHYAHLLPGQLPLSKPDAKESKPGVEQASKDADHQQQLRGRSAEEQQERVAERREK
jgi:hypothetical protein